MVTRWLAYRRLDPLISISVGAKSTSHKAAARLWTCAFHSPSSGRAEINELGPMGVRFMPLHVCVYLLEVRQVCAPRPIWAHRVCAAAYLDQMKHAPSILFLAYKGQHRRRMHVHIFRSTRSQQALFYTYALKNFSERRAYNICLQNGTRINLC